LPFAFGLKAARQRSPAEFGCGRAAVPRRWRSGSAALPFLVWFEGCAAAQALPGLVAAGRRCPAAGGAAAPPYRSWFGLKAARQRSPAGFGCGRAAVPRRWRKRQRTPYQVWLRQGGGAPPLAERQLRPTVRLWFEGCAAAQALPSLVAVGRRCPAAGGAAAQPYRSSLV